MPQQTTGCITTYRGVLFECCYYGAFARREGQLEQLATAQRAAEHSRTALHDFGAGAILELRPAAAGATIMVPFTASFVPAIDVAGGRITVAPPVETQAKGRGD